ncbi:hypothetical protein [Sphingomonas oryzagri]
MSYDQTMLRLGSTAIAAVLALSATPVLAQGSDTVVAPAPVAIAPPAAPATASLEATPASTAPAAATPSASAPAPMATQSTLVMHVADDSTGSSDSVADKPVPKAAHHVAAKTGPAVSAKAAPKAETVSPAPVVAAAMPEASPAAAIPPAPVSQAAPAAPKTAAPAEQSIDDETLMIAGAGGLGVLLLAGGGYALARRKRRDDEEEMSSAYEPETAEVAQPAVIEPVMTAPVTAAPVAPMPLPPAIGDPLPEDFDISHYGRHAQAAFRGPTPENPSLSLKTRLKRAAFFDRRERASAEAGAMPLPATGKAEQRETMTRPAPAEQIIYRPQRVTKSGFRPVFNTSRR